MKTKLKYLAAAAIPFWVVQLIVLLRGYTDSRAILQIYLPVFVVSAVLLLAGQTWLGHGLWLSASAGLVVEVLYHASGAVRFDTLGVILNGVVLVGGLILSFGIQMAVNRRKKNKKAKAAAETANHT